MHVTLSPPPPTTADRAAQSLWNVTAFAAYADSPDPSARDVIAAANAPLASQCARRFLHRGEPFDDLQQVARIGLLLAIDRFDTTRGVPFGAYATATMMGQLRRHFRDRTWGVHVPRRAKDLCGAVADASAALHSDLGREPTLGEVAIRTALTESTVADVRHSIQARRITSLTSSTPHSFTEGSAVDATDRIIDQVLVSAMLLTLAPRARRIMELRFFEERSQSQIAAEVGASQVHVGRLIANSLAALRQSAGTGRLMAAAS